MDTRYLKTDISAPLLEPLPPAKKRLHADRNGEVILPQRLPNKGERRVPSFSSTACTKPIERSSNPPSQ